MPTYKVLSPIKANGKITRDGQVELTARAAAAAVERGELELLKEAKPSKAELEKAEAEKAAAEKAAAEKAAADKAAAKK